MGDKIKIVALVDGFRRGGIAHSAAGQLHDVSDFTAGQLAQIKSEKMLSVTVIKEKNAQDKAENTAKNKDKEAVKSKKDVDGGEEQSVVATENQK